MSGFLSSHAGLIELSLFELLAVGWAARELWSVRRSLRRDREQAAGRADAAAADARPPAPREPG